MSVGNRTARCHHLSRRSISLIGDQGLGIKQVASVGSAQGEGLEVLGVSNFSASVPALECPAAHRAQGGAEPVVPPRCPRVESLPRRGRRSGRSGLRVQWTDHSRCGPQSRVRRYLWPVVRAAASARWSRRRPGQPSPPRQVARSERRLDTRALGRPCPVRTAPTEAESPALKVLRCICR